MWLELEIYHTYVRQALGLILLRACAHVWSSAGFLALSNGGIASGRDSQTEGRGKNSAVGGMLKAQKGAWRRWEEERQKRELEFKEERRCRKEESARREEQTFQQTQVLQVLGQGVQLQGETMKKRAESDKEMKVARLTEQDDIESYLTTFE